MMSAQLAGGKNYAICSSVQSYKLSTALLYRVAHLGNLLRSPIAIGSKIKSYRPEKCTIQLGLGTVLCHLNKKDPILAPVFVLIICQISGHSINTCHSTLDTKELGYLLTATASHTDSRIAQFGYRGLNCLYLYSFIEHLSLNTEIFSNITDHHIL